MTASVADPKNCGRAALPFPGSFAGRPRSAAIALARITRCHRSRLIPAEAVILG